MTFSDYLCNVNSINRHIEYLILRQDCVTVPGLGAFIAQYSSARIDDKTGIIYPPSRTLSFNAEVTHNDGLLATSIARATGSTFDSAVMTINSQVASLKSQIEEHGEFAVGRLGILRNNEEGALVFEPFDSTSISPRYTGLSSFSIRPFEILASSTEEKNKKPLYIRAVFRAAASVAILLGLGLMLSTPVIEHSPEMATFGKSIIPVKIAPEKIIIENPRQILSFARPDSATGTGTYVPVITTETIADNDVPTKSAQDDDRFFLIVASLPSRQKAEEYIAANPGDKLRILASDGRYRIYVASGATYDSAYSYLSSEDNATKYPDAWVFRR